MFEYVDVVHTTVVIKKLQILARRACHIDSSIGLLDIISMDAPDIIGKIAAAMGHTDFEVGKGIERTFIHQRSHGHGLLKGLPDRVPDLPRPLAYIRHSRGVQIDERA